MESWKNKIDEVAEIVRALVRLALKVGTLMAVLRLLFSR